LYFKPKNLATINRYLDPIEQTYKQQTTQFGTVETKIKSHFTVTMKLQKLAICGFIAGLTSSTAFDVNFLDAAILQDMLEAYTEHQPSTCTGTNGATTFTFDYPGINAASEWYPDFESFEEDLFLAAMTNTDPIGNRSWTIRLGQGGNMYSQ
jgi:hypothetical protein